MTLMVLHAVITPFLTYPSTKSTWFAFDLAMGGLDPHEEREAEEAVMVGTSRPGDIGGLRRRAAGASSYKG